MAEKSLKVLHFLDNRVDIPHISDVDKYTEACKGIYNSLISRNKQDKENSYVAEYFDDIRGTIILIIPTNPFDKALYPIMIGNKKLRKQVYDKLSEIPRDLPKGSIIYDKETKYFYYKVSEKELIPITKDNSNYVTKEDIKGLHSDNFFVIGDDYSDTDILGDGFKPILIVDKKTKLDYVTQMVTTHIYDKGAE